MKLKTSSRRTHAFMFLACAAILCISQFPNLIVSECSRNVMIFNFGDSNSDTGGYAAAHGITFGFPDGRTFFHQSSDRLCDGRLVLDLLCESLNMNYLTPYLESVKPNSKNGVNFAIGGSSILPKNILFSLSTQVLQFARFQALSLELQSKGLRNLVGKEDFKNAVYMMDIGQNDLAGAFTYLSQVSQVIEKIPSLISEVKDAISDIYRRGGKNFWIHNTGPLGCLPQKLATRNASKLNDLDDYGCLKSMNEAAEEFNNQLKALCEQLRLQLKNATIVYVDIYAIKYEIIANSNAYGIQNPLMVCCGFGGPPYNYSPNITCRESGYTLCEEGSAYISWDGVHYTEYANAIVASKILSTNYSTPPLKLHYFCT